MTAKVLNICRYPVKGLSPEFLFDVVLQSGGALENDRRFALALGSTLFDDNTPHWLPKTNFLSLVRNEKLANLETVFDDETDSLQILQGGKKVLHAKLSDKASCDNLEDFFADYLEDEVKGKLRFVESKGETIFTDQKQKLISIINLASLRDLERVVGKPVDPIRFRANIYVDGISPWSEFNWIKRTISCEDVILKVKDCIDRCGAINVDPQTGERDINLVDILESYFGHFNMGVFAEVKKGGKIAVGDVLKPFRKCNID